MNFPKLFNSRQTYHAISLNKSQVEDSLGRLEKIILDTLDFNEVVQKIVDSLLLELSYLKLGYRIVVLGLIDKDSNTLKRISISRTEEAVKALENTPVPFPKIDIPLSVTTNLCIQVIRDKKAYTTTHWPDILMPALTEKEALEIQNIVGIKTSLVYPVISKNEVLGVMIFSLIKESKDIKQEEYGLIQRFTDIVGLAVQNSLLYSSLEKVKNNLEQANERLQNLDRLKDEFVSLASHELRTPMTAIKSYLWLFIQYNQTQINPKERLYIERAYAATDRLIGLVNDMLNVSRIESGRMALLFKPVEMIQLTKEVFEELAPTSQKQKVELILSPASETLPKVSADSNKIREVLINLIGNSLKFTEAGGKITVKMHLDSDMFVVDVIDTGKGIKAEDMQKLFQKFGIINENYLQKANAQGTGLGLYISKSIINLHGGQIWVKSEGENKGTTFSFSLKVDHQESHSTDIAPN